MALSDLGLGHTRDYHGSKLMSILNVVILGETYFFLQRFAFSRVYTQPPSVDPASCSFSSWGPSSPQQGAVVALPDNIGDGLHVVPPASSFNRALWWAL